ncbi:DUF397 domain-containing protein [Dactylosporangium sp. NPDC049525]|uniref:DUF397 domain-containing protein n=1 Tax=Dactylosporangium sp. NPDC049525 TaxID=3154730 RepID=UPI00343A2E28
MHEPQKANWRKSCLCDSVNCVEVAEAGSEVFIRNSRKPGEVLRVSREDWDVFAAGVAAGDFQFT